MFRSIHHRLAFNRAIFRSFSTTSAPTTFAHPLDNLRTCTDVTSISNLVLSTNPELFESRDCANVFYHLIRLQRTKKIVDFPIEPVQKVVSIALKLKHHPKTASFLFRNIMHRDFETVEPRISQVAEHVVPLIDFQTLTPAEILSLLKTFSVNNRASLLVFKTHLVNQLKLRNLDDFSHSDLQKLAWSLVNSDIFDRDIFSKISFRLCLCKWNLFTPEEISLLACSFATADLVNDEVFDMILQELSIRKLDQFPLKERLILDLSLKMAGKQRILL